MDGRRLKVPNGIDGFSHACLAIRVGRCCKTVDVNTTIEQLLSQHPAPPIYGWTMAPKFIANAQQ